MAEFARGKHAPAEISTFGITDLEELRDKRGWAEHREGFSKVEASGLYQSDGNSLVSTTLSHALIVAAGGALGSVGRYLIGALAIRLWGPNFPWGTFIVNIAGSLMIGLLVEAVARALNQSADMRLFIVTGFLGGFTTFSSFSLDAMTMIERGDVLPAVAYVTASVVLALIAVFAGLAIGRMVF